MAKDHSKSSLIQSDPYWFTAQTSTLTIELDCDSMSWMSLQQRIAGTDSLNKHVEQISFRQYMTFCEHRQLKGWQPHFQPTVDESSISTTVHCFVAFATWKHGANSCKMPQQMALEITNHKVETSLWRAWVAWIKQGQQIWVQKIYGERSFEIITDSIWSILIHSSNIDPDNRAGLWLHELNVFATKNSGNGFLKQTCRTNLFLAVRHIFRTRTSESLAATLRTHCG